jgi:hypothetical protein
MPIIPSAVAGSGLAPKNKSTPKVVVAPVQLHKPTLSTCILGTTLVYKIVRTTASPFCIYPWESAASNCQVDSELRIDSGIR